MSQNVAFNREDPQYPGIRQLFQDYFRGGKVINPTVHANDEMFRYSCEFCAERPLGAMAYFRAGLSIYDLVAYVADWAFGGLQNVHSFLDFASGYGRFTRVLAAQYPPEQIWASDILPETVGFQQREFGVNAFLSTTSPEQTQPGLLFDFIYVGSLFTHLPESTFRRWLQKLYSLLTPNGVLVFTTHGLEHLDPGIPEPPGGFHYITQTEIPALSTRDYGATLVSEAYVKSILQEVAGNANHWFQKSALGYLQDVWVVSSRRPDRSFLYDQGPQGHVDYIDWLSPTHLGVQCWAACICGSHTVDEIKVLLNGEYCGSMQVNYERADVAQHLKRPDKSFAGSRALIRTPRPVNPWEDVISVIAVCSGRKECTLRTMNACNLLQFSPHSVRSAGSLYEEVSSTKRSKLHRALDYTLDGDWRTLMAKGRDFLRRR